MKTFVKVLLFMLTATLFIQCEKEEQRPHANFEITDENFLIALFEKGVDYNGDDLISTSEAEAVKVLDVSFREISDLKGIEFFVNLDTLLCNGNGLRKLDISKNTGLKYLNCRINKLINLDVSKNTDLETIRCELNGLSRLDISTNIVL